MYHGSNASIKFIIDHSIWSTLIWLGDLVYAHTRYGDLFAMSYQMKMEDDPGQTVGSGSTSIHGYRLAPHRAP